MISLQRTLSLGYLAQHPTRATLVVLSIALGVAALVATQSLTRSLNLAAREAHNPLAGVADLVVTNAQSGVERELADQIRDARIPGLKSVRSLVVTRGLLTLSEGASPRIVPSLPGRKDQPAGTDSDEKVFRRSVYIIGIDWAEQEAQDGDPGKQARPDLSLWDIEINWHNVRAAHVLDLLFRMRALITPPLARALARARQKPQGKKVDPLDPVRCQVRTAGETNKIIVIGTLQRFPKADALLQGDAMILDLPSAAKIAYPQRPNHVTQINLLIEEGADLLDVQRQVQEVVGEKALVRTVEANFETARDLTAGLELGFAIGGAGALVVGLFLVYNVLSVSVAERRHDIGILRSVGATRYQIAKLFIGEAAVLGFTGAVLGLPLGYFLGQLSLGPLRSVVSDLLIPMEAVTFQLEPLVMLLAVIAGILTAILAALLPSMQAALEEPADAVRRVPRSAQSWLLVLSLLGVLVFVVLGVGSVWWRQYLPARWGIFGGFVCLLLAVVVATPLITRVVGRLLQPLARILLGVQARLAVDNLVRTPVRTGLVIAALAVTGGLMVQTAGFLKSSEDAVRVWIDESIAADLFVTSGSPVTAAAKAQPVHESLISKLEKLDEVQTVLGVRFHQIDYNNQIVLMLALDPGAFGESSDRSLARDLARFPRLKEPGTVVVSENFAALNDVEVGDTISFKGNKGREVNLEVIGTMVDYTWNRGIILVDRAWYKKEFADDLVDVMDVWLKPGADPEEVRKEIRRRWGESEALQAVTRKEFHASVKAQLERIYNLAYAQQTVVGLVALLGVASALFISILQRRRQLGLLRAVGATRGQILGTVVAEATLMGLVGAGIAVVVGLALEWYVVNLMLIAEAGFTFPMSIPWQAGGAVLGVTVLLATLVGLWPAYHATRLRIPDAIAYE